MRKLDILMIKSFIGPFVLTTAVSNFILLIQYLLKYFDDFVGKNLGFSVFAELLFYFSLNMLQVALPLGVLVASLMTFGNLGENFELTAIKGSGISLLRTLRPIFVFVFILSIGAFYFNNYAIPAANLKAYSLLYDIKHTKPALDIKAGSFYNGIPNFSIKAKEKLPDGRTLLDVIIYDHSSGRGNKMVILADSSLMYTILDDRYLKLELYNGNYYNELEKKRSKVDQLYRTEYYRMDMVFSLASFDLKRRKEELFQNNRQMKNIDELTVDIDSFGVVINRSKQNLVENAVKVFRYHFDDKDVLNRLKPIEVEKDSVVRKEKLLKASVFPFMSIIQQLFSSDQEQQPTFTLRDLWFFNEDKEEDSLSVFYSDSAHYASDSIEMPTPLLKDRKFKNRKLAVKEMEDGDDKGNKTRKRRKKRRVEEHFLLDTVGWEYMELRLEDKRTKKKAINTLALSQARNIKQKVSSVQKRVYEAQKNKNLYTIEKYKKYAQAMACILMFMIGAPLGAIIKKGGLGVPTIIAILFFIVYYVFTSIGEKSAKEDAMNPYFAVWLSDIVLLPFGLFFLRQARIDARLFDIDFYHIWIEKLKVKFAKNA